MSQVINDWLAQDEKQWDILDLGGDAVAVVIAGRSVLSDVFLNARTDLDTFTKSNGDCSVDIFSAPSCETSRVGHGSPRRNHLKPGPGAKGSSVDVRTLKPRSKVAKASTTKIPSSPLLASSESPARSFPTRSLEFLESLYLFTASDLKTVVFPKSLVGTLNGLSTLFSASGTPSSTLEVFSRIPLILLWTWLNLLPFNINNQRQPAAILEDKINKSWRPLPS
ncbi:MAG: hypothetical protein Q9166_007999, partial [cf. Caloplaca sp. 2 TL-2023]